MTRLDDILRTTIDELVEEEYNLADHPSFEELVRYADDDLEAGRRDDVQRHLLGCEDCLRATVEAVSFPDIEAPTEYLTLSPEDIEDRWASFQKRLAEQNEVMLLPRKSKAVAVVFAAAASLALVGIGALALSRGLDFRNRFDSIVVNTSIHSLLPERATNTAVNRSPDDPHGSDGVQVIEISPRTEAILLILNVESFEEAPGYKAEFFRNGEARPFWSSTAIQRTEDLNFNVTLPRSALETGSYTLDLSSVSPERETRIARYRMEFVEPD